MYFDSFGIQYIPQDVLNKKTKPNSITHNIFKMQSHDSIMCELFCIFFIEYMIAKKMLLNYKNSFPPNDYQKKDKIRYKYFKNNFGKRKGKSWL